MELWVPLISEYVFPVMITLYLLHRIEKKLDILNDSMQSVSNRLSQTNLKRESQPPVKIKAQ